MTAGACLEAAFALGKCVSVWDGLGVLVEMGVLNLPLSQPLPAVVRGSCLCPGSLTIWAGTRHRGAVGQLGLWGGALPSGRLALAHLSSPTSEPC